MAWRIPVKGKTQDAQERGRPGRRGSSLLIPVRLKITLPFLLLSAVLILAAGYVASRYLLETVKERFTNQLVNAGKLASDWMVQEENRLLATCRLLAHTQGFAEAVEAADANRLREMVLPVMLNAGQEAVLALDPDGRPVLALRRADGGAGEAYQASAGGGEPVAAGFVQKVIEHSADAQGDKFAGVISDSAGQVFFVAGPVMADNGDLAGVVLVGKSIPTLLKEIREAVLAQITIYPIEAGPVSSTLFLQQEIIPLEPGLAQQILGRQESDTPIRSFKVASVGYAEILKPWEVRGGEDIGIMGAALPENFWITPKQITGVQAFLIICGAIAGVLLIGLATSRQITRPLSQVVSASQQVAQGDYQVQVPVRGNDEITLLANAFNQMVSGLREGSIYRDLLGRTVSPEVREALRQSFASGDLRLEGHSLKATVMMSDIRDFTTLSEREEPATIFRWLNEYFGELVPVIARYGGVVDKFEGDAILAFFGILPKPLPPEDSARLACQAAVEMIDLVEKINTRRKERGEPALHTGIGINTGALTAGGLGTADRLNFTVIGDTVNTTQRIENLTRAFGESGIVISENTLAAIQNRRSGFTIEPLGEHTLKGKSELLWVYRLRPYRGGQHPRGRMGPELLDREILNENR